MLRTIASISLMSSSPLPLCHMRQRRSAVSFTVVKWWSRLRSSSLSGLLLSFLWVGTAALVVTAAVTVRRRLEQLVSIWLLWPLLPPYGFGYDPTGSARIEIKPREAEVYVDGYLVGTVDDFDGSMQRLHLPYGEHEIQIYLPGYRTIREKVLFRPGATLKLSSVMEPFRRARRRSRGPVRRKAPVRQLRSGPPPDETRKGSHRGSGTALRRRTSAASPFARSRPMPK